MAKGLCCESQVQFQPDFLRKSFWIGHCLAVGDLPKWQRSPLCLRSPKQVIPTVFPLENAFGGIGLRIGRHTGYFGLGGGQGGL